MPRGFATRPPSGLDLRNSLLWLTLLGVSFVAPRTGLAESFTDPTVRKQFDLRLERFHAGDLDLGPVDHVGRLRARVPLRAHSVELIVPWIYLRDSKELDSAAPWIELGNVTVGLGLHESTRPARFLLLLGLPTGSLHGSSRRLSPAGAYGSLARFVPEFELYSGIADGFARAELQGRLLDRRGAILHGTAAFLLRRIPSGGDNEFEADFVGALSAEFIRDDLVFAAGTDLRIVANGNVEDQLQADITMGIGVNNGSVRTSLQLRVPVNELRRDALPWGIGVQVAFVPPPD